MLGCQISITFYAISFHKILGVSILIIVSVLYIYINLVHSCLFCAPLGHRNEEYDPRYEAFPYQ